MEEGCAKSRVWPYTAKFKCECVWCTEQKGNRNATAIFGVDVSNIQVGGKHKAAISECEVSQNKFTGSKKGQFPETDDAVFTFFFQERCKAGINCSILFLQPIQLLYHSSKI
jgi:hypothetical protein